MKNRKSLVWGLVGLAVIILLGGYFYNEDQKRRLAEAEAIDKQEAGAPEATSGTDTAAETAKTEAAAGTPKTESAAETVKTETTAETPKTETGTETAKTEIGTKTSQAETAAETPKSETSTDAPQTETVTQTPDEKDEEVVAAEKDATTAEAAADNKTETGELSSAEKTTSAAVEPVVPPKFDLVRVEPDGSTVIAGQAKAGTVVEVVTGDKVLAQSDVGDSGDFAAIFDDPLEPGDYEIVLRVVEEGEVVAQSEEVATVSVPEENPEALLVIVTKPGEASRILTQPEAPETASVAGDKPVAAVSDDKVASSSGADAEEATSETTTAKSDELTDASSDKDASLSAEDKTTETDSKQPASEAATESGSQMAAVDGSVKSTGQGEASAETEKPEPSAMTGENTDETSTANADAAETVKAGDVAAEAKLRIDAVEIEGGRVFVAGSATAGATVRVYADGTTIGDSQVSATGRFLVEAEHEIAVGQHTISADLMMPGSDATTMRVAVPFTRPEGDSVAAVAAPVATAADTTEKTASNAEETVAKKPVEATSMAKAETATTKTEDDTAAVPAASESQTAASSDETMSAPKPASQSAEGKSMAEEEKPAVKTAMVEPAESPEEEKSVKTEPVDPKAMTATSETKPVVQQAAKEPAETQSAETEATSDEVAETKADNQDQTEKTAEMKPAEANKSASSGDAASQDTKLAAVETTKTEEPETVVQEALEPKEGSVIIRRGDTLWQISRRVYGRGVRYTTIYLANSDQISNPDFIEPGQIFMVPNEPLTNAEQLHKERIRRR